MCWCARCSPRNGWTALFLVTSLLTSATRCLFQASAWSRHRFVDRAGGCHPGTLHLFISASRGGASMRHHQNCHLSESLRLDRVVLPKAPALKAMAATQSEPAESSPGVRVTEKPYSSRWRQDICRTTYHEALARSTTRNSCAMPTEKMAT